ncbi:hypothetical protein WJX81_007481 [Elliptochloris bilobata]|uniref:Copper homeostasis protein cutC homolog n=1 Tax=Elliptochloris bilobata TaxID=381761 RepID=A0AAW1QV81_9CHLO
MTPSSGLIQAVRGAVQHTTALNVLIRPRGGDFLYSDSERQVMAHDIEAAAALGADGVVLGLLTADGEIDAEHLAPLIRLCRSKGLDLTFHRAFDCARDLQAALEQLIKCKVARVLTSGGRASALEGAAVISGLVVQAAGRIAVMAGGGIRAGNAAALLQRTGVRELHTSAHRRVPSGMRWTPAMELACRGLGGA